MAQLSPTTFDMSIDDQRFLTPGDNYNFTLRINNLFLNYVQVIAISNIQVLLEKDLFYNIQVGQLLPCCIRGSLSLCGRQGSWYPIITVNGTDQFGYPQQMPFRWTRPVISTDFHPIYDARFARSIWTDDESKIMQIKNLLNYYGFDCSTIGKEIQVPMPPGKDFMDLEKDWASGGHCFISVLTPRDKTSDGQLALPPPWVTTESGLSYGPNRPELAFIEKGVVRVGRYSLMDNDRIIQYELVNNQVYLEGGAFQKIFKFRTECQERETERTLQGVGQFVFLGLAIYGGVKILYDLFG